MTQPTGNPSPTPASHRAPAPPFDPQQLLVRCASSASVAVLILDKFEKQVASDLKEITATIRAADSQQCARTAHALKGAAGTVTAGDLAQVASRIESLSRAGDVAGAEQALALLKREVDRCLAYLPAARQSLKDPAEPPKGTEG